MTDAPARLAMITLDTSDPRADAAFWSAFLGWEVAHSEEEYAMLTGPAHALGFGRVDGYQAPRWPDERGGKQVHLDLAVGDLDEAEQTATALGAGVVDPQPGATWRVLRDPSGHLFCLTRAENWGSWG